MPGLLGTISGRVTLDIRQAVAAYAALRAQNARTVYAMRGTSESFIGSGRAMVWAGGAMVGAFGLAVKEAAEFERKMDFFGAVTDTNSKKMQQLSKYTLQLAQDTIFSADEIADGIIELGKAGVNADQIMRGIGDAMANLGAAGDIPLAQSGQIITSTIQQYDLAAQDAVRVTDLLAGAANASIADISDIGVSLKYVGGVANAAGLTFEDTATAISLLAKAGIRGSTAGTSLRQMIVSLGGATGPAKETLQDLGIITEDGSNLFYTQEGRLKSLSKVYQILQDHTADLTQKERLMALRTIFNNRALSAAAILTREGSKGFKDMNDEMAKTTAADVARQRLDNLSGDIEILKGNIQTMLVQAGSPFQETLRGWVQGITKLVQKFGELDPETQKMIVQSIAVAGAVLVAMGAFNLIIGTIFRFVAGLIKMGAAVKLIFGFLKNMWVWARLLVSVFGGQLVAAIAAFTAPVWIAIAVIVALVAAFVILYRKSETFRNGVKAMIEALKVAGQAIFNFLKLLVTDPGAAWDKLKAAAQIALDWIVAKVKEVPGLIKSALSRLGDAAAAGVNSLIDWFAKLPGRVLSLIASFISTLMSYFTLANVGAVLGAALAGIVSLFVTLPIRILALIARLVFGIVGLFFSILGKVAPALGYLLGFVIGFFVRMAIKTVVLVAKMIINIVKFFQSLPGRAARFVVQLVQRAIALFNAIRTRLPGLAADAVGGIVRFFSQLPGKAARFFSKLFTTAVAWLRKLPGKAREFAGNLVSNFYQVLSNLPSTVANILDKVIEAFKAVVQKGFDAAKSFASGLWNGFKDGLGISSPSYIERAMFQMNDTVGKESKKLAKQTAHVQKISRKMAETKFSTGGFSTTAGRPSYAALASMHRMNQSRAQAAFLQSSSGPRRDDSRRVKGKGTKSRIIEGRLSIDESGRAWIEGLAEDVVDDNAGFENRRRFARG